MEELEAAELSAEAECISCGVAVPTARGVIVEGVKAEQVENWFGEQRLRIMRK